MEIPIITIELSGMRETVKKALMAHNKQFNDMVSASVDKAFNRETLSTKIDIEIEKALNTAIEELGQHYQIREILKDLVLASLAKKHEEINQSREKL